MRHHNAASQQHPACSSLPAVYLIATPSFCLLSSLSPSLHPSVILSPPLIRGSPKQMGIVRLGGAFQHHNLSPHAALQSRGKGRSISHIARHICGALACASVREIKISGTARSGSTSTETDRGRWGNDCWGN